MCEVSREFAKYLFNTNIEVFRLYADGTEGVVDDVEEIQSHEGIFGVER